MTSNSPEQLQTQLNALVIAGAVSNPLAEVFAVWDQVRAQQPEAWQEMCLRVIADPQHDVLRALCRQCDAFWGCRVPLHPELAEQVSAMLDAVADR
ncbi:hypothetical protein ACFP9V_18475 [Deinococcus radiopugnans]|uniref:Uncharacterized protein n=1 Tax=Deinococcus radiopugnans ATCC 19172 TaxID=585398 RepID=A0A5C4Y7V6_9DEIO|nr:hypothetical protein [Deinococcus radiopugnans]MBB6017455.1 hypothetical protein [Deinococcus radiopugnans ATCC 19172]TNM71982.1 hypothetical protein FHR04_06365 [Deinococcus radiopugnans ATCC 19172]